MTNDIKNPLNGHELRLEINRILNGLIDSYEFEIHGEYIHLTHKYLAILSGTIVDILNTEGYTIQLITYSEDKFFEVGDKKVNKPIVIFKYGCINYGN